MVGLDDAPFLLEDGDDGGGSWSRHKQQLRILLQHSNAFMQTAMLLCLLVVLFPLFVSDLFFSYMYLSGGLFVEAYVNEYLCPYMAFYDLGMVIFGTCTPLRRWLRHMRFLLLIFVVGRYLLQSPGTTLWDVAKLFLKLGALNWLSSSSLGGAFAYFLGRFFFISNTLAEFSVSTTVLRGASIFDISPVANFNLFVLGTYTVVHFWLYVKNDVLGSLS